MSRKIPPPIPVVGGQGGDASREEQLREWEEEQRRLREQQAAASATPPPAPSAVVPAQPSPSGADAGQVSVVMESGAPGYLPMPAFTEPDSEDPADRLEFYSQGILAVQYVAKSNHERADQQRLIGLGLRLMAMKDEELHKVAGYDTFGDLTEDRFGIKKHQANNIIRVTPVAQALEDITTQELKERPLRVLAPVLDRHGSSAVRETWQEAARHGNVTDKALREAANFLGYGLPKELPVGLEGKQQERSSGRTSESLRAVERIRHLAETDPARARREAEELENAVRELLEELAGNLE